MSKPCDAVPDCHFGLEYIENGYCALTYDAEPGTDGYCATCKCAGEVTEDVKLNATKVTELVEDRDSLPPILAVRLTREIHKGWDRVKQRIFPREKNNATVVFGPELTMPGTGIKYELYAVSRHSGSTPFNGHWTAHVKNNGSWYFTSDESVTPVGSDVVFSEDSFRQACILFYKDPSRLPGNIKRTTDPSDYQEAHAGVGQEDCQEDYPKDYAGVGQRTMPELTKEDEEAYEELMNSMYGYEDDNQEDPDYYAGVGEGYTPSARVSGQDDSSSLSLPSICTHSRDPDDENRTSTSFEIYE